jgi:hypothetical protein
MKLKAIACFLLVILPMSLSAEIRTSPVGQPESATEQPDNLEKAVETAIWDYIRHERRLLASGDLFEINIAADHGVLGITLLTEYDSNFPVFVSPKDTSCIIEYSEENDWICWLTPDTQDTIICAKGAYSEPVPLLRFSDNAVVKDISSVPNRKFEYKKKLFVWRDNTYEDSTEVLALLLERNRVDFISPRISPFWGNDNDGGEHVIYDLKILRQGKIKKYHNYGLSGNGFQGRMRSLWFKWKGSIRSFLDSLEES